MEHPEQETYKQKSDNDVGPLWNPPWPWLWNMIHLRARWDFS